MTLKEEFDAVQKRISRVLTALELARLEASQNGERFFLADIYVGIAYEAAFSAVRQLRDDPSKSLPPIAGVDYESFEFYAKWLAGEKKLKFESVSKSLLLVAQTLVGEAESHLETAKFLMLDLD